VHERYYLSVCGFTLYMHVRSDFHLLVHANVFSYEDVHHVAAYSVCCIVLTYLCSPAGPCAAWAPALKTKGGESDSTCWSERTKCAYLREKKRERFEKERKKENKKGREIDTSKNERKSWSVTTSQVGKIFFCDI